MSRVFILEMPKHDISDAKNFGEFVEVFGKHHRRKNRLWSKEFKHDEIADRFEELDFDFKQDAILLAGNMQLTLLVVTALISYSTPLQVLAFDSTQNEYSLQTLEL
jgi:hypothetical protein